MSQHKRGPLPVGETAATNAARMTRGMREGPGMIGSGRHRHYLVQKPWSSEHNETEQGWKKM